MWNDGFELVMSAAGIGGLEKTAMSALWKRMKVVPREGGSGYQLFAPGIDKAIGELIMNPVSGAVEVSRIAPEFRGMGLGKKMYGHAMRRMPDVALASDIVQTTASAPIWARMHRKPDYGAWMNLGATSGAYDPELTPAFQRWAQQAIAGEDSHVGALRDFFGRAASSPRRSLAQMIAPTRAATVESALESGITSGNVYPNWAGALPLEARINPFDAGEARKVVPEGFEGFEEFLTPQFQGMTEKEWLERAYEAAPYELAGGAEARAAEAARRAGEVGKGKGLSEEALEEQWDQAFGRAGQQQEASSLMGSLAEAIRPSQRTGPAAPEGVNPALWQRHLSRVEDLPGSKGRKARKKVKAQAKAERAAEKAKTE